MDPETAITVLSVARRLQALVDNETSDSEKIDQQWKAPYKTALTQLRDAASTEGDPSHHLEKALNSFDTAQHQGEPAARAHASHRLRPSHRRLDVDVPPVDLVVEQVGQVALEGFLVEERIVSIDHDANVLEGHGAFFRG